jgi:hypothetical protein
MINFTKTHKIDQTWHAIKEPNLLMGGYFQQYVEPFHHVIVEISFFSLSFRGSSYS